jgi:hypothetical protein
MVCGVKGSIFWRRRGFLRRIIGRLMIRKCIVTGSRRLKCCDKFVVYPLGLIAIHLVLYISAAPDDLYA